MKVGYARVSTTGQSLEIQREKLKQAGCEKIFEEKKTGAKTAGREELKKALEYVREGDTLHITKLDRLARSLKDLTKIADTLDKKNVGFIVIDQEINTTTPTGKLIFHMIGAIGEFERSLIIERTQEGRAKAKMQGRKFGRKKSLSDDQLKFLKADVLAGEYSKRDLAKKHQIGESTLYRLIKDL